jgi:AcrR family transcriptional regulator
VTASAPRRRVEDQTELLDRALAAFARYGFDGASMRDVCRELGLSHNYVYKQYGSKEALWYAAVDHGFGSLLEIFVEVVTTTEGDEIDRLRAVLVRFVEVCAESPALLQVINNEATVGGPRLDFISRTYIMPSMRLVDTLLHALQRSGRVRAIPRGMFYFLFTLGAGGPFALPALAERFGDTADPSDPEALHAYALEVVDFLLAGLQHHHIRRDETDDAPGVRSGASSRA